MLKNKKIFGIPLIFVLLVSIAGATIIAPIVYVAVHATGTYTDSGYPGTPQYVVADGDPTDVITYNQVGNDVIVDFPVWKSMNDVEYQKILVVTPNIDGTLIIRNIQYTGNGITVMNAEINPVEYMGQYSYAIPSSPQANSFGIADAKANKPYYFSMKTSTNSSAAIGDKVGVNFSIELIPLE